MLALVIVAFNNGCVFYRYHSSACKQRGAAYAERVDKLKRDALEQVSIGTDRDEVLRFFHENGLPVTFDSAASEYTGTIQTKGCAPSGCASDDSLLGLRVRVDARGAVAAEPVVGALYTNCL